MLCTYQRSISYHGTSIRINQHCALYDMWYWSYYRIWVVPPNCRITPWWYMSKKSMRISFIECTWYDNKRWNNEMYGINTSTRVRMIRSMIVAITTRIQYIASIPIRMIQWDCITPRWDWTQVHIFAWSPILTMPTLCTRINPSFHPNIDIMISSRSETVVMAILSWSINFHTREHLSKRIIWHVVYYNNTGCLGHHGRSKHMI